MLKQAEDSRARRLQRRRRGGDVYLAAKKCNSVAAAAATGREEEEVQRGGSGRKGGDAPCLRTNVKNGGENDWLAGSDKGERTKFSLPQSNC